MRTVGLGMRWWLSAAGRILANAAILTGAGTAVTVAQAQTGSHSLMCWWMRSTSTPGEADVCAQCMQPCLWEAARSPHEKALHWWAPWGLLLNVPLCEMSLLHTILQSEIPRPYLDIKEIDLIVSLLKQAFNSILWGLKTLLNNWAAKRLVISVFIACIDLSVVNPFKYPCHTGPDGSL